MPKATHTLTPPAPVLTSGKAALAKLEINTQLAKLAAGIATDHPDAALILICQQHPRNIEAFCDEPGDGTPDNPFWVEYERTRDTLYEARPDTIAGMAAVALAAKAEALQLDGSEHPANCPAEDFAWGLVNGLIQLNAAPNPDVELIALCSEIDAMEAKFLLPGTDYELDDDLKYRDPVVRDLIDRQDKLIERMCAITATSPQGHQARARTIVKWAPDLPTNAGCMEQELIGALLRDLIAGGSV